MIRTVSLSVGLVSLMMLLSLNAVALTGESSSPVGVLDTVPPLFGDLVVIPPLAAAGERVTLTFTVSKPLAAAPLVHINGHPAQPVGGNKSTNYTYDYVIGDTDAPGMATITLAGADALGNVGLLENTTALQIGPQQSQLPVYAFPVFLLLPLAGVFLLLRTRRAARFLLLVVVLSAVSTVSAQTPVVSNVSFVQEPGGVGSTQVNIYYDLDAPNGPCDITVLLSKDNGADDFIHPVTAVSGAVVGVESGTEHHIVWAIAEDYPNEYIAEAQLRVMADDGLSLFTLTYMAGANGAIAGDTPQIVVEGASGAPVTAVADYGYHFVAWSDGRTDNPRTDADVSDDVTVEALFEINIYTLTYTAGTNGALLGDTPQLVMHGTDATPVEAVPAEDCYFLQWSDGRRDNPRTDVNVVRHRTIMALFRSNTRTVILPGDVPLVLRRVAPGAFLMGSDDTERGRNANEGPVREVTFGYEYFIGKYPVTQAQWLALMGDWPGDAPTVADGLGNNHPAYHISWEDAQAFIAALNAHIANTEQGEAAFRLPSEAEWEYATRAGTQTRFHFGDSLAVADACEDDGVRGQNMWYCGNNGMTGVKAVGQQPPNALGLCDPHGNVREWCEDDGHDDYTGAPQDGAAWVDPIRGATRVVRGGHWNSDAADCRAAARDNAAPDQRDATLGFRLCLGYPVGSGHRIGVWHNAVFAGAGQAGGLINGVVGIKGSTCLLGDNLPDGGIAVFALDMSGTTLTHNNYDGIPASLYQRVPPLPTIELDGRTVSTLNGVFRVRKGLVALSGLSMVGEPADTSNQKRLMDAVYVTDGWTGNSTLPDGTPTMVFSDNGWEQHYDLGNRLRCPMISDDWRNPDGTRVYNVNTGTWYTHEEYFREVLVGDPDVPDDGFYEGDLTIDAFNNPGFYFNATSGETLTGAIVAGITPNPSHSYLLIKPNTNVLFINGTIRINGKLTLMGQSAQRTLYYSGRAAILVNGNVDVDANLLTVNNGDINDVTNSFPENNSLAIMTAGTMRVGYTARNDVMAALYAEGQMQFVKQSNIVGSIVSNLFMMGTNVPYIFQVPALADHLPLGMIANHPM